MLGLVPKIEEAEEVAVVRDGHRPHIHIAGALHQAVDAATAVEHAVVGVHMQMHEVSTDVCGVGHAEADNREGLAVRGRA